jgi:hypothetical protein
MMTRQGFVKLARDAMERMQSCPGDGWEIVMFVMQADVVGEAVEGPIVGVGFGGRKTI